jgi:glycosyltransferase involved in cell wall biosynthesis
MSGRLVNLSEWLDEADSQNVKVILVHDKSDDTTGDELFKLLKRKNSHNFSLVETDSRSPGMARNCGLDVVNTPWFSFVDADDSVSVFSILELLRETETSDCKIGVGSYVSINLRTGEETLVRPPAAKSDALALHLANKMGIWRLVLSTSSFGDLRFTNHKMGEDFLYVSLVLNRSNQIFTSSKIVYKYFHGGYWNLTSNRFVMSEMIGVIKHIKKLEPLTNNAVAFRVFAIQKLTLSVLKNLKMTEKTIEKSRLSISLLSHPIYLLKLLVSLKKVEPGEINE